MLNFVKLPIWLLGGPAVQPPVLSTGLDTIAPSGSFTVKSIVFWIASSRPLVLESAMLAATVHAPPRFGAVRSVELPLCRAAVPSPVAGQWTAPILSWSRHRPHATGPLAASLHTV